MARFSSILIGNESLVIQCGEMLLDRGHEVAAVVSRNADVRVWAQGKGLRLEAPGRDLAARLGERQADWLLSIANLDMIPAEVLALARHGAVNFHDGPLPRYAGLNAPVWALINGETEHGISWHLIADGVDEGDILAQRMFAIAPIDTALTLNTKCYAAAIESFDGVVDALASGAPVRQPQDLSARSYFGLAKRPDGMGRLDFTKPAEELAALVRALDHGDYRNPLTCAKIAIGAAIYTVTQATVLTGASERPGVVMAVDGRGLTVGTATGPLQLGGLRDGNGDTVVVDVAVGEVLASLTQAEAGAINAAMAARIRHEPEWGARLEELVPATLPLAGARGGVAEITQVPLEVPAGQAPEIMIRAMALLAARLDAQGVADCAYRCAAMAEPAVAGYVAGWVPVRCGGAAALATMESDIARANASGGFAMDLAQRLAGRHRIVVPDIGLSEGCEPALIAGTCLTLAVQGAQAVMVVDSARVSRDLAQMMLARVTHVAHQLAAGVAVGDIDVLPETERALVLHGWNKTARETTPATIHAQFEAQVLRNPEAEALVFEHESLTYGGLNARANKVAHVLRDMGVKPGMPVGLHTRRDVDMLVGALGILKAGGAYVPLDPAFPADRIALYIEDSAAPVIVTQTGMVERLSTDAQLLLLDGDSRLADAPEGNPAAATMPDDLAYLIFTSGSTGRPKGVMVEHRNVSNFFTGMDERIARDGADVWLAVTSLSFDISVLELFYTLARGFKLVLSNDDNRALVSSGMVPVSDQAMDFSLYYWGNDDAVGKQKYELLLEGSRFADENGFCAIWTPERHFHAFGGPYPNPSVTGAAVAAITKNLAVRAGSIVAPLHHPARIAEEWAVIDNLTGGRVGLAVASGWMPDDFVLRPENTPPHNKAALTESIKIIRKLWAGEAVEFPTQNGGTHAVITQPRPISKEMPMWMTTAGNPETWKEAGALGANVLTHLLGQSIDEVAGKIVLYHQALRDAGYEPENFKVTLMLHTYVADSRAAAREVAREPMKNYLRSAAGLIKQYAWAFPAFKRPEGVKNAFDLDLGELEPDELEGILDFAFERYFNDSGLFGTIEDCVARVETLKRIGVDEVACLIEYGIATETVLAGLRPLAEVRRLANTAVTLDENDHSIAAQIIRHRVTHLQCTPSMARMIAMNDEARLALGRVRHLMIGGEALSAALVEDLASASGATIENMYGPTETTIWSTTQTAVAGNGTLGIGTPIANTQVYVLDAQQQPVPVGVAGELYIGGHGVARGYWQRDDLTQERFMPDPFVVAEDAAPGGARMYRTGDLVRQTMGGGLEFLGRADHQIKLRGYRIELGEIEAAMDAFDGVRQAVVLAREDVPGVVRLVGYMTVDAPVDEAGLRTALLARMPEYMVPGQFVTLAEFPLTPNRKVDRNALPAPVAPQTKVVAMAAGSVEARIAAIWGGLLGVANITGRDSFFDIGGHSLLAVQAHREIRDQMGVKGLSITDIFRFPKLADLAQKVAGLTGETGAPVPVDNAAPERAASRQEAMAKRREMRAQRRQGRA